MLQGQHLRKNYGAVTVISDETSFILNDNQHVGLIGPNGVGKSTLLRCLVGAEQLDAGTIVKSPPDLSIGYLGIPYLLPHTVSPETAELCHLQAPGLRVEATPAVVERETPLYRHRYAPCALHVSISKQRSGLLEVCRIKALGEPARRPRSTPGGPLCTCLAAAIAGRGSWPPAAPRIWPAGGGRYPGLVGNRFQLLSYPEWPAVAAGCPEPIHFRLVEVLTLLAHRHRLGQLTPCLV